MRPDPDPLTTPEFIRAAAFEAATGRKPRVSWWRRLWRAVRNRL